MSTNNKNMNFSVEELEELLAKAKKDGVTSIDASLLLEPDIEGALAEYTSSEEFDKIDQLIFLLRSYQQSVLGGYSYNLNPIDVTELEKEEIDVFQGMYDNIQAKYFDAFRLSKLTQENSKALIRKYLENFYPKLTRKRKTISVQTATPIQDQDEKQPSFLTTTSVEVPDTEEETDTPF